MYVTLANTFEPASKANAILVPEQTAAGKNPLRRTKAGQTLFNEYDPARYIYEVVTGVLRMTRVTECGRRQVIAFGFPGDILGFPHQGRYHCDCDVIASGEVRVHNRRILEDPTIDPSMHRYLLNSALEEISAMQDHFMMLGRKSASEKMASFLVVLMARIGKVRSGINQITLPMCRSDIADFLGMTTETVSRTISQFRADGVIALESAQVINILDPEGLLMLGEHD